MYKSGGYLRLVGNFQGGPRSMHIPGDPHGRVVAKGHTHPNEGRDAFVQKGGVWVPVQFPTGAAALSDDIDNSWNRKGQNSYLDVVVTQNAIYFYYNSGVITSYKRN